MAEQQEDFTYSQQEGNALGGAGTNEALIRRRSGQQGSSSRLPERALDLKGQQGSGPASITGRSYERMADTAGKVNALQHGMTGPQATSGQEKRDTLMNARDLRQDPYRDSLGYKGDYGTTLSAGGYTAAEDQRKAFNTHVIDTNAAITSEKGSIAADTATVASEFATANSTLNRQKSDALGGLPSRTSVEGAYRDWQRSWHTARIYSGSIGNPGTHEATVRVPGEVAGDWFEALAGSGYTVQDNNIYVKGRGAEVYDSYDDVINQSKTAFYNSAGSQVAAANESIDNAASSINSQFVEATNLVNSQYNTAQTNLASRRGTVQGAEEGLANEITAREETLLAIRKSYTDRLGRIDEALNASVGREEGSRSEAQPVKQLSSKMPGAQAQAA
jgi:hypothetical protein